MTDMRRTPRPEALNAAASIMFEALEELDAEARPSNWRDDDSEADAWRKLDAALAKAREQAA